MLLLFSEEIFFLTGFHQFIESLHSGRSERAEARPAISVEDALLTSKTKAELWHEVKILSKSKQLLNLNMRKLILFSQPLQEP